MAVGELIIHCRVHGDIEMRELSAEENAVLDKVHEQHPLLGKWMTSTADIIVERGAFIKRLTDENNRLKTTMVKLRDELHETFCAPDRPDDEWCEAVRLVLAGKSADGMFNLLHQRNKATQ